MVPEIYILTSVRQRKKNNVTNYIRFRCWDKWSLNWHIMPRLNYCLLEFVKVSLRAGCAHIHVCRSTKLSYYQTQFSWCLLIILVLFSQIFLEIIDLQSRMKSIKNKSILKQTCPFTLIELLIVYANITFTPTQFSRVESMIILSCQI